MDLTFTASGYIEVRHNGEIVSRHRQEREAIESVINSPLTGEFVITYPTVKAKKLTSALGELQITGNFNGIA